MCASEPRPSHSEALTPFDDSPIRASYPAPGKAELSALRAGSPAAEIVASANIRIASLYHRDGLAGASPRAFARRAVVERLERIAAALAPMGLRLVIFDAFRSIETQRALFDKIHAEVIASNPSWSSEETFAEAKKFVAHPDEPSRFKVPPHNSGGAVDLGLERIDDGTAVFMGAGFDEVSARSRTDFYEGPFDAGEGLTEAQWHEARANRRILFHAMVGEGFTNYEEEWWHYDLGNPIWSKVLGVECVFLSMEAEVDALARQG